MRPRDCPEGQFVVTLRNGIGAHVPRSAAAIAANDSIPCGYQRGCHSATVCAIRVEPAPLQSLARFWSAELCTREPTSVGRKANLYLLEGRRFALGGTSGSALPRASKAESGRAESGRDQSRPARVCADVERRRRAAGHLYWMLNTPVIICDSYALADPMLRTRT
jgi:hypothetical protein